MEKNKEPYLITGGISFDDRGSVSFVNEFNFKKIKRFYMVENYQQNFVRAWHAHKNESKYALVTKGSAIVSAVEIDDWKQPSKDKKIFKFILSESKPAIVFIPNGFANGFKSLTKDMKIIFFSTSTLEESKNDDFRFDANYFGSDVWKIIER